MFFFGLNQFEVVDKWIWFFHCISFAFVT